jgi:uncharacterized RDD family membrane protein YckC
MRCEKCGKELFRGAVTCPHCRYTHPVQGRRPASGGHRSIGVEGPSARMAGGRSRASESEDNLIPFPRGLAIGGSETIRIAEASRESEKARTVPSWREEVKERVKASRGRREGPAVALGEVEPPRQTAAPHLPPPKNPLVEAALNRIRRTPVEKVAGASTPRPVRPTPPTTDRLPKVDASPLAERRKGVETGAPEQAQPLECNEPSLPAQIPLEEIPRQNRPVVTVPETIPPTRAASTGELLREAEERAEEPVEPATIPLEEGAHPAPRARVETQIIPLHWLLQSQEQERTRPATFWVRTMAGCWDLEILAVAYLPIFASYATLNTILARETLVVLVGLLAVLCFVYQLVTLLMAGRTFGMAMQQMELRSLDDPEKRIRWHQYLRRAAGATIALFCPPLNLLIYTVQGRGLSIPDQLSGTLPVVARRTVVRQGSTGQPSPQDA